MTRQEMTGKRDLDFSMWIRKNLPDSSNGFMASDIDFYIFNYKTLNHALVEVKTHSSELKRWQREMYERLGRWIGEGGSSEGWNFIGFFIIKFENKDFEDGKVYLNGNESSELEIKTILSLEEHQNHTNDVHWSLKPFPEHI